MKKKIQLAVLVLSVVLITVSSAKAQHTMMIAFTGTGGAYEGGNPQLDQNLLTIGSYMYGMTSGGGSAGLGVIFKVMPDGTGYTKLLDFTGLSNGSRPNGSFYTDGTFLYGMTTTGGVNDLGTIFKIMPDGSGYTKLMDFASSGTGTSPKGTLISVGTFLYGVAGNTIFKIKPDGTGFLTLTSPGAVGSLYSDGTFLYTMGGSGAGEIFKIMPDGTGYTNLMNFVPATSGGYPMGSLISDGTFLYGMTEGSTTNNGTVFKIMPDGTGYVRLHAFSGTDGRNPKGSLLLVGSDLYGMTRDGGGSNYGTIFKISGLGTFSIVHNFAGFPGSFPNGSLISDGSFLYGMTSGGGPLGATRGTIFKYQIGPLNIKETNSSEDVVVYPNPSSSSINIAVTEKSQITFCNALGAIVKSTEINGHASVDVSDLSEGVYVLTISDSKTTKRTSVAVKK
jgi:uncharacterized repeat protein (TIGR03803 family)